VHKYIICKYLINLGLQFTEQLESMSKIDDELENFCLSAHYLAHTEFGVTGSDRYKAYSGAVNRLKSH
jgi:hypothetical protein